MSELTLFLIRFAYLAILWIFVLSAISVIRTDMFGARMPSGGAAPPRSERGQKAAQGAGQARAARRPTWRSSRAPTPATAPTSRRPRSSSAAARTPRSASTTTTSRPGTPGSPAPSDQWFVEDLGSTNGTYVGSARITQPTTLSLGTQVRIGKTILELRK